MFTQITKKNIRKLLTLVSITTAGLGIANTANATIVEFHTSQGSFQVNLFDQNTPATVKNFLNYVEGDHYNNSVVHRVSSGFVVQAGGFKFNGTWPLTPLVPNVPVINEAIYSNVKGTISMAKKGNDINSATNQWFFNLSDNNTGPAKEGNLDRQNGGFTAFGQVIGDGMTVVNKIAQLKLCDYENLKGIPMVMDSDQTCADMVVPGEENFAVIEQIKVIDPSKTTASDLHPLESKYPDSDGDGVKDIDDAFPSDPSISVPDVEDSGGSITWFALVVLALVSTRKRFIKS